MKDRNGKTILQGCRNLAAAILYQAMSDVAFPMNFQQYVPKKRRKEYIPMQLEAREWLASPDSKCWADHLGIEQWPPPERALKRLKAELQLRHRRYMNMRKRMAVT